MDKKIEEEVNAAIQEWCQGDCVVGEQCFVYRCDPQKPITEDSQGLNEDENLVEVEVKGFAVVTQTCDIVRSCSSRPFVEVAPLVEVDEDNLNQIRKGKKPQYAFIPGVEKKQLVADLDRIMTVEKAVVAQWERIPGSSSDEERRKITQVIARKRIRYAFPDDFHDLANKLQRRLQEKHNKQTEEGEALRSLREIRVRAAPDWEEDEIEIMLSFIRHEGELDFKGTGWDKLLEKWLNLIPAKGRYTSVDGLVVTLEDMTAKEYIESDPLDLDHLSNSYD